MYDFRARRRELYDAATTTTFVKFSFASEPGFEKTGGSPRRAREKQKERRGRVGVPSETAGGETEIEREAARGDRVEGKSCAVSVCTSYREGVEIETEGPTTTTTTTTTTRAMPRGLGVSRPPRTAEHRRKLSESRRAYNKTARGKKNIQKHGQKMRNWYKTEDGMKFKQGYGQKMREWYETEAGMKVQQERAQKLRNYYKTEAGLKHKQKLRELGRRKARQRWAENKNVYGAHAPPSPEKCAHAFHQDGLRPGEATLVVNLNTVWNQPTLCHFVSAVDGDQLPSLSFNLLHCDTLMFGSFVDERYLHGIPARPPDFLTSTRVSIAVTVKKVGKSPPPCCRCSDLALHLADRTLHRANLSCPRLLSAGISLHRDACPPGDNQVDGGR